jgi:hypothetical protein
MGGLTRSPRPAAPSAAAGQETAGQLPRYGSGLTGRDQMAGCARAGPARARPGSRMVPETFTQRASSGFRLLARRPGAARPGRVPNGTGGFEIVTLRGAVGAMAGERLAPALGAVAASAGEPAAGRLIISQMLAGAGGPGFVLALALGCPGPQLAGFGYGIPRWRGAPPPEGCRVAVLACAQGLGMSEALRAAVLAAIQPGRFRPGFPA